MNRLFVFIEQEFRYLTELFYPRVCMACGKSLIKSEEILCTHCELKLPKTNYHLWHENPVKKVFDGRVDIFSATARYHYKKGGNVQNLLHNFKYRGNSSIGVKIGADFGHELMLSPDFKTVDYIIPVPLHFKKLKLRGFNQSERFAYGLSQTMDGNLENNNLVRNVFTETQTRKSRWDRYKNVSNIFEVKQPDKLRGKHILLVDDVITTGSTIEACLNALKDIEKIKMSVAAIASPVGT
ncbi:MAG: ComF family protein [Bacteroidales bacterium]|nr:ComF family protein [Bacteroidales bacterium]